MENREGSGEQTRDEQVTDPKERFRSSVYYVIYDTIIAELESRFVDFQNIVTNFKCLMPPHLGNMEAFECLTATYSKDIDVNLAKSEYRQFCEFYKKTPEFADNPPDVLQQILLMIHKWDIHNANPNLTILYRIMGTIAISSATCERSFSRLKLTKTYLRSTIWGNSDLVHWRYSALSANSLKL